MDHEYEARITLWDGIGHHAASAVRAGIEDAVRGALEPGEEAHATLDADGRITLVVGTVGELGDNEAAMVRDAIADVLSATAEADEEFTVDEFTIRGGGGLAP